MGGYCVGLGGRRDSAIPIASAAAVLLGSERRTSWWRGRSPPCAERERLAVPTPAEEALSPIRFRWKPLE